MSTTVTEEKETQLLTHSRLGCFRACHRRDYLRYELGVRPDRDSFTIRVGKAFAGAVEAASKGLDVAAAMEACVEDPYDLALVAAMFDGHTRRWADEPVEHVEAELPFNLPLVNPDTGKPTTVWRLGGKVDRIVRLPDGRLAVMEYKTTSKDFGPGEDYWTRLHLDTQLSIYVMAVRELGFDVSTILYDVTRRPALRPSAVPLVDEQGSKIVLDSAGQRVRTKDGKKWRETGDSSLGYVLQTRPETPEEFTARVAAAMAADPQKHFARIEIARLDQDLAECARDVWAQQLEMREAQRSGRFYKNPDACFGQGFKCDYVGICHRHDLETVTPEGFVRVTEMHPELAVHSAD